MKKIFLAIILATVCCFEVNAQTQGVITNESIIALLNKGDSTQQIISAIKRDSLRNITFNLGYMRQLKQAGADSTLVTFIQRICKQENTYEGIYWWNTGDKPVRIAHTAFCKAKKGIGVGNILLAAASPVYLATQAAGRIATAAMKKKNGTPAMLTSEDDFKLLYLPGKTSNVVLTTDRPVFRFYLPGNDIQNFGEKDAEDWYKSAMLDVQNPEEYQLVLIRKKGKNRIIDSDCEWGNGAFEGKRKKKRYVVECNVEQFNNNSFEITPMKALKPGEYMFFWKLGMQTPIFQQQPFAFDFTVPKSK